MNVIKRFFDGCRPMLKTFLSEIEVDGVPKTLHTIVASSTGTASSATVSIWGHILDVTDYPTFQMEMAVDFDSTFPYLDFQGDAADIFVTISPSANKLRGYEIHYSNKDKEIVSLAYVEISELGVYIKPTPWLEYYQHPNERPGMSAADISWDINNILSGGSDTIDFVYGWVNAYEKWYAEERARV